MEWQEVIEHPNLRDLPFKIETNEWGQIVMTPVTGRHGRRQGRLAKWFNRMGAGDNIIIECPIQTSKGVKVADMAWGSIDFFMRNGDNDSPYKESPEIVVEVQSPSNRAAETEEKKQLYFEAGAKEVWLCDQEGDMRFFHPQQGEMEKSVLFEEFPAHIDIDFV